MGRKKIDKVEWTGMPTDETELKEIKAGILCTHPVFTAIEQEKNNLNDIFDDLNSKFGIPRRIFNKLAKFSYFGNADETFGKTDEVKEAWEALEGITDEQ